MDLRARVTEAFEESLRIKKDAQHSLVSPIVRAAELMCAAIRSGHKILCCGNGGSAADAQHFAAELVNRYLMERPPLAALALTTDSSTLTSIANDYRFDDIFAKQVMALGQAGDVLLVISTSGNSGNLAEAINAAHTQGMRVVLLSGRDGGAMARLAETGDVEIRVAAQSTPRIQEVHILAIHCLCDLIDQQLFTTEGQDSP